MEKGQEIADEVVVDKEILEEETETNEVELDEEGNPIEKELEPWQQVEDGDVDAVPVDTHIKMKQKLKGRIGKKDDRIAELEEKIRNLESRPEKKETSTTLPKRPRSVDFDSDEEYENALDDWLEKRLKAGFEQTETTRAKSKAAEQYQKNVEKAVDDHYERSAKLVNESGISSDHFKEADTEVRKAVDAIIPGKGDAVTDHIISLLGEGSEKVMYFIGRNKTARAEFQGLLAEDATGMKAAVYLGQQKERLISPRKKTSSAPPPAKKADGDATPKTSDAWKRKYDKAHKAGNGQEAYNVKKQARAAGVNVSAW